MELIVPLLLLGTDLAAVIYLIRRLVRHVRAVPARPAASPDARVLRRRFVRGVFGLALLVGMVRFVGDAIPKGDGYSRELLVVWEHAGLAVLAAMLVAPLVVRLVSGDAWATSSIVLPVAGIAVALPLTLHFLAFLAVGERTMDDWAAIALIGSAIPHAVFATLFAARTVSLVRTGETALPIGELFTITTVAGAVPGFIIGMGFVALTGVFVLPVISLVEWLALREHAATATGLPRAIVAPCRA